VPVTSKAVQLTFRKSTCSGGLWPVFALTFQPEYFQQVGLLQLS